MASMRVRWWMGSVLLGCGPGLPDGVQGFSDGFADEIGDTSTGDTIGDGDGDPTTGDGDGDGVCPQIELASEQSFVFEDLLAGDEPSLVPELCLPVVSADRSLLWVAPTTGVYQMALLSEVEAWASVTAGKCEGPSFGCVFGDGTLFEFEAVAGEPYTFVVESNQTGFFQLQVQLAGGTQSCPIGQLFGPIDFVGGSTLGAPGQFGSDCGGAESSDLGWLFIPEVSGTYRFDTAGSSFDTVLEVLGDVCGGPVLACNDDNEFNTNAVVDVELQAGQPVTVVVDGYGGQSGEYQLSLELLGSSSGLCDSAEFLPSTLPVALAWPIDLDFGNLFFDCSFANSERRLRWTAPEDALVRVRQTALPNFSGLAVFPDGCSEAGFECQVSGSDFEPEVVLSVVAGQELLIVSEYEFGQPGDVQLTIEPFAPVVGCGTPLPAGVPSQAMGTTNGSNNDYIGTCAFNPAPEREFWWTAPATGNYTISTAGSTYDSLIYVRNGGCDGVELGCNDDWEGSLSAQLDVGLIAGQTISIFVDGYNGPGSFDLTITQN